MTHPLDIVRRSRLGAFEPFGESATHGPLRCGLCGGGHLYMPYRSFMVNRRGSICSQTMWETTLVGKSHVLVSWDAMIFCYNLAR